MLTDKPVRVHVSPWLLSTQYNLQVWKHPPSRAQTSSCGRLPVLPPHLGVHSSPDLPACLHCPAPAELVFMVCPDFTPHLSSPSFKIRALSTVLIYKCPWLLQSTLSLSGYHRMLWTFPRRCYSSYDRECSLSSYTHYSLAWMMYLSRPSECVSPVA